MGIGIEAVLRAEHADDSLITLGGLEQDLSQASNDHIFLNGRIGTKNLIAEGNKNNYLFVSKLWHRNGDNPQYLANSLKFMVFMKECFPKNCGLFPNKSVSIAL